MTSITSNSPWPTQCSARAAVNECLTTYPPPWTPAILRASGTEASHAPRSPAPIVPLLGRALLLCGALLGIAQAASAASADRTSLDAPTQPLTVHAPLPVYRARFERTRPVIAIVGENSSAELSVLEIPYPIDRELPPLGAFPSAGSLMKTIDGIRVLYGRNTACGVALNFVYPLISKSPLAKEAQVP